MAKASGSPVGDEELRSELKRLGYEAGPITETTRRLYAEKLRQLKTKTAGSSEATPKNTPTSNCPEQQQSNTTSSEHSVTPSRIAPTTAFEPGSDSPRPLSLSLTFTHPLVPLPSLSPSSPFPPPLPFPLLSLSPSPPFPPPLPFPLPSLSPSSPSVVSQLLQSLNNTSHLASDTAFLFPSGEVILASRAILATQCHDLLPVLYSREDPFVVNVGTLSGHCSRFFVRPSELVADLKQKISLSEAVSVPEQQLFLDQAELRNETQISRTGMRDGCLVQLVLTLLSPCHQEQQQTTYFTSCVNPSLSIHHLCLRFGLEQLVPVGGAYGSLRPPRVPLPPHICHIVHVYDVPCPAWAVFVHYLYSQQLREDAALEVAVCCCLLGERFRVPGLCQSALGLVQRGLSSSSAPSLLRFADSVHSRSLREVCVAYLKSLELQ